MSLIRKIFGRKKKEEPKPSIQVDALQKLHNTEQMLVSKREVLEKNIKKESATVSKNIHTNKNAAVNALERKKRYKIQLSQIEGMLLNVIQERLALENAKTNIIVMDVMKSSRNAVKHSNSKVDIEGIENMMNDMAESQDMTKEISEALSNPIRSVTNAQEEELLAELETLELETLDEQASNMDQMQAAKFPLPAIKTSGSTKKIKKKTEQKNSMMA